jgi:hypothetical protein
MKTTQLLKGIVLLTILTLSFSCKKTNRNNAAEVVQQNNLGDVTFLDFAFMAEQVAQGPKYFSTFNGDCSTLKYDTTGTTITATIDYGTEVCACNDGKKRSGKIVIVYPINNTAVGAVTTVTPTDYVVNASSIVGLRTATVKSKDIVEVVSTATITVGEKLDPIYWNANWSKKFIENTNSPNVIAGRNYEITGTTTGKTARGDDFTVNITEALKVQSGCRSIKGGITTITSSNFKDEAKVDYGNGACDSHASLIYGKKEVVLNL